jgi:hypothetical protein
LNALDDRGPPVEPVNPLDHAAQVFRVSQRVNEAIEAIIPSCWTDRRAAGFGSRIPNWGARHAPAIILAVLWALAGNEEVLKYCLGLGQTHGTKRAWLGGLTMPLRGTRRSMEPEEGFSEIDVLERFAEQIAQ